MFNPFKVAMPPMRPSSSVTTVRNYYDMFTVAMPDCLLPLLQQRQSTCFIAMLSGCEPLHDLSLQNLTDLDTLLAHETDEAHNLILDGRQLCLLKWFVQTERFLVTQRLTPMLDSVSNADYRGLLNELMTSINQPTRVVNLSFFQGR